MIFTTSWDDGYLSDLRIAELLKKYGATGTFYVCPQGQHGQKMLSETQIAELGSHHEVGAHTMTHPRLTRVDASVAKKEIEGSKQWIESIIKKPCTMFCYPCGDYNEATKTMVQNAGFIGARTVQGLQFQEKDMFELPASLHLYPIPIRPKYTRWWHFIDIFGPLRFRWKRLNDIGISFYARRSWQSLARALFLKALENNEQFFHLWGHAHELDGFGLWEELESFLAFVAAHDVVHATNTELVQSLSSSQ